MRCDLHMHTSRSDGAKDPLEVVQLARRGGLDLISITDHDSVEAYDELDATPRATDGIRLIRGVEITTALPDGDELHILGYFPRGFTGRFRAFLDEVQAERRDRMRIAVDRLRLRGLPIEMEDVLRRCGGRVISRSHLAQTLVDKGVVRTFGAAFKHYLSSRHAIVPTPSIRPRRAIETIRRERGISIWAHPAPTELAPQLERLTRAGLNGLEVYARRWADEPELARAATEQRLLAAGGSDWHGHNPSDHLGGYSVPADRIRQFLSFFDVRPTCDA